MEKVHFDDLTEINVPYGLLSDATKEALAWADLQKGEWEAFTVIGWNTPKEPLNNFIQWDTDVVRAKPASQRDIPWDFISDRYNHLAMDESGEWVLFKQKPFYSGRVWIGGNPLFIGGLFNLPTDINPARSLYTRPEKD